MFFLPAVKDRTYTDHALPSTENKGRLVSGKGRVLLVDDDGVQTYDAVRHLKPDMRVLVCSGLAPKEEIRQMIDNGCRDFLLKPFDIAKLSEKIESVFSA